MSSKWVYHTPVFECDPMNLEILSQSPWVGHRRFAYDLVCYTKPKTIVELGSYYGCSAFAFLQAIKDQHLDAAFFAVDTWQGDDFTKNDYQEDIYGAYQKINDACYGMLHSEMLRETFDQACGRFCDGAIDLLHIDGSHKYEDVKHDYERWKCKVSSEGIVLFHDVGADLLFGKTMGSHVFWEELKAKEPFTLELPFSNGLGVLLFSEKQYHLIQRAVDLGVYQRYINLQDTINKDQLRKNSFIIRDLRTYNANLQHQIGILNEHLDRYSKDTSAMTSYIAQLEREKSELQQKVDQNAAEREQVAAEAAELRCQVGQYCATVAGKDGYIEQLETQKVQLCSFASEKEKYAQELERQIGKLNAFAKRKEDYAAELEAQVKQLTEFAASKERYIQELKGQIESLAQLLREKDGYCKQLETSRRELEHFAEKKELYAQQVEKEKAQLEAFVDHKQSYIEELERQSADLKEFVAGKESYAADLERQVADLKEYAAGKESYAADLERQVADLKEYAAGKESYAADLERQVADLKEYAAGKESYAADLERQVADLKEYAAGKESYVADLERQVADLKEYAAGKEAYEAELEMRISSLQDDIVQLRTDLETSTEIIAAKSTEVEELQTQNANARHEADCLHRENEQLRQDKERTELSYNILKQRVCKFPFGKRLFKNLP